jgi:uncharacterized membrane protein YidH (DUF202 family)
VTDHGLLDVGAQAERTILAWQRTGIGAMAVGALLVHGHVDQHLLPPWPGLFLTAAAAFAVLILVPRRYRRIVRTVRAGRTPLSGVLVPGVTILLVLLIVGVGVGYGIDLLKD